MYSLRNITVIYCFTQIQSFCNVAELTDPLSFNHYSPHFISVTTCDSEDLTLIKLRWKEELASS